MVCVWVKGKNCSTEATQGKENSFIRMYELPSSFLNVFAYTEQSVVAKDVKCLTSIVYLIHSMVVRLHTCLDSNHVLQRALGVAICFEHLVENQCSPIRVERDFGTMTGSQGSHDVKNPFLKVFFLGLWLPKKLY